MDFWSGKLIKLIVKLKIQGKCRRSLIKTRWMQDKLMHLRKQIYKNKIELLFQFQKEELNSVLQETVKVFFFLCSTPRRMHANRIFYKEKKIQRLII